VAVLCVFSHFGRSIAGTVFHLLFLIEQLINIDALTNDGFEDLELILEADLLIFDLLLDQDILF
jgi:hypothetical protein